MRHEDDLIRNAKRIEHALDDVRVMVDGLLRTGIGAESRTREIDYHHAVFVAQVARYGAQVKCRSGRFHGAHEDHRVLAFALRVDRDLLAGGVHHGDVALLVFRELVARCGRVGIMLDAEVYRADDDDHAEDNEVAFGVVHEFLEDREAVVVLGDQVEQDFQAERRAERQHAHDEHIQRHAPDIAVRAHLVADKVRTENIHEYPVHEVDLERESAQESKHLTHHRESLVLRVFCGRQERYVITRDGERGRAGHLQDDHTYIEHAVILEARGGCYGRSVLGDGKAGRSDGGAYCRPDDALLLFFLICEPDAHEERGNCVDPPVAEAQHVADNGICEDPRAHDGERRAAFLAIREEEPDVENRDREHVPRERIQRERDDALVDPQEEVHEARHDRNEQDAVQAVHEEINEVVLFGAQAPDEAVAGTEEKERHQQVSYGHENFQPRLSHRIRHPRRGHHLPHVMEHYENGEDAEYPFGLLKCHGAVIPFCGLGFFI